MSLLQDALRRAQKSPGAQQPPPPVPFSDLPYGRSGSRRRLLAGLVAAAFLASAAGIFFLARQYAPTGARVAQALPPPSPAPASPAVPETKAAAAPAPGTSRTATVAATRPSGRAAGRTGTGGPAVSRIPRPTSDAAGKGQGPGSGQDSLVDKFNAAVGALDGGTPAEAVRLFREVTAASPDLVEAWNGLGLGLLRQKDTEGADMSFSRSLALAPRYVPGLLNLGLLRLEQGRAAEAAELFARAAELSPGSPAPRVNLAVAQSRLGRPGEAEETLLAARRRFPGNPDVLYQLGAVYERMGNRKESAGAYTGFLSASGGSRPGLEGRVRERLRSWEPGSRLDAGTPLPSK